MLIRLTGIFATKFISNLPWGRQVKLKSSVRLYDTYFKLVQKLGSPSFIGAVLTDRTEELWEALSLNPEISLLWARQFSLLGSFPYLCIIAGQAWQGRRTQCWKRFLQSEKRSAR